MGAAESHDLVVIERASALQIFTTPEAIDPILARVREEIEKFVPDVSTKKGRDAIASMAHRVAQSKTYLESIGKDLADKQKEIPKLIDASRRRIRDTLDAWKEEVRRPLTEWEAADFARFAKLCAGINEMQTAGEECARDWMSLTALQMRAMLETVQATPMGDHWQERAVDAAKAKDTAIAQMQTAIAKREKYDSEQAELARLRAEQEARAKKEAAEKAEQERIAREKRIVDEAAATARREAEEKAAREQREKERKAKAERDRIEAEKQAAIRAQEAAERREAEAKANAAREAEEAVQRERERVEREQAQAKAEAEKRERNKKHRERVNAAAIDALLHLVEREQAESIITLIAAGKVPAVSIAY